MKKENPVLGEFQQITRHIVMEKDLNAFGNLFGGIMLSWMDEASALYVMEAIGYADFVTVSMNDVFFKTPAHRGDAMVFACRTVRTGKSSITVETRAFVKEPTSRQRREVITCKITFVCLKLGKPYPYFQSEEYMDWLLERERSEAI